MQTAGLKSKRIESIDLVRGIVMVIMALDHSRDFFHREAFTDDPLNLATTTPILYFTRWITHFCAPTFVFLSGVSAWLQSRRKTTAELSKFLISRGLWLILLEFTILSIGVSADIHFGIITLATIWAIGISMVILGLVIWLPFNLVLALGLLIVFGHNSFDFMEAAGNGNFSFGWHRPGPVPLSADHSIMILYPFLPWTGLMITGYCFGKIFSAYDEQVRNKILLRTGIAVILLFILLRLADIYGDPLHWSRQQNLLHSFFSFMKLQKYPPSLLYICATIGPVLILLSLIKNTSGRLSKIFIVYGRVPMFYYTLHFFFLTIIRMILYISRGHSMEEGMTGTPGIPFKFITPGEGYDLWMAYALWIGVVVALYPLCRWYDKYKTAHPEKKWLSYL
ncbi:MAG: heparan-alpha-glucosaminide N-acetyltransferase domain-containing protein [Ferruginibacter sp.]